MQQFTQEWKATKHNQHFSMPSPLLWVALLCQRKKIKKMACMQHKIPGSSIICPATQRSYGLFLTGLVVYSIIKLRPAFKRQVGRQIYKTGPGKIFVDFFSPTQKLAVNISCRKKVLILFLMSVDWYI
jgi:hypothetical protein